MKRLIALALVILFFALVGMPISAVNMASVVDGLKAKAEVDGYRFIQVGEDGMTEQIRQELAVEDEIYLDDQPKGSVTVQVLDMESDKPVAGANCLLSYSTMIYTVNTDGNREQQANPFLLFDLGQTPANGNLIFTDTYFTSSRQIAEGTPPFASGLTVHLAYIVDADPELEINSAADNYIATSDPENFQAIVKAIDGRTRLKFSELKTVINQQASQKYNEIIRYLFDGEFAMFADQVMVRISNVPQFAPLANSGRSELPLSELKAYVDANHDLFKAEVADRYFADYGGFEPDFAIQHEPGYDSITTYKNGTRKTVTGRHYLGLKIFDQVTGGTGYAINTSGFNYRAYVYIDGYSQGSTIGGTLRQDHVDTDIKFRFYLSKDLAPVAVQEGYNAVAGKLTNAVGDPIQGAMISMIGTELSATTDEKGQFSFTRLKKEMFSLAIINPEDGETMPARVIYAGKEYPLDGIPIVLDGENHVFKIEVIGGMAAVPANELFAKILPWLILLFVLIVILVVFLVILANRKKKVCRHCGHKLSRDVKFCIKCGQPSEQQ